MWLGILSETTYYAKHNSLLQNIIQKQMKQFFCLKELLLGASAFLLFSFFSYGRISSMNKNEPEMINAFSSNSEIAQKFGVHEIVLHINNVVENPFDLDCQVTFYAPSKKRVTVNAFYDGGNTWRARLYINETGVWKWELSCQDIPELERRKGSFKSVDSELKGMLRKDPDNPKAWKTDNGQWFINISDTGYMLFNKSEKFWKRYISDLSKLGITSVRAGSLGGQCWDKKSHANRYLLETYPDCPGLTMDNYPWEELDQLKMDLEKFQNTDERLIWMLNNYPDMYVQFILFGLETWGKDDSGLKWKMVSQNTREKAMKYMIARWSAFPQLFFLIVNDMHCSEKFPNNQEYVREVGRFFATNDPWNHLISTGPNRYQQFPFLEDEDLKWVSYIHIEDNVALDAEKIKLYEQYPLHVFLGEDWYEQTKTANGKNWFEQTKTVYSSSSIQNPEYYYRWLFWSWILSGGSANYGGRWARLQPYFMTDSLVYVEPFSEEKLQFRDQMKGLNSMKYISIFFKNHNIDLSGFIPDHEFVIDIDKRLYNGYLKLMRKGNEEFVIYDPNAQIKGINASPQIARTVQFTIDFSGLNKTYSGIWYRPDSGECLETAKINGTKKIEFTAPWQGVDAILFLREMNE